MHFLFFLSTNGEVGSHIHSRNQSFIYRENRKNHNSSITKISRHSLDDSATLVSVGGMNHARSSECHNYGFFSDTTIRPPHKGGIPQCPNSTFCTIVLQLLSKISSIFGHKLEGWIFRNQHKKITYLHSIMISV